MTEWHPAIASIVANGALNSADWYRGQTNGLGKILLAIILALDIPPDASPTTDDADPLLFGEWRASRVLAAVEKR